VIDGLANWRIDGLRIHRRSSAVPLYFRVFAIMF
jgi:hypothetical protein